MNLIILILWYILPLTLSSTISPLCYDEIARYEYNLNCDDSHLRSLTTKTSIIAKIQKPTTTTSTTTTTTIKKDYRLSTIPPECKYELWREILGEKCFPSIIRRLPMTPASPSSSSSSSSSPSPSSSFSSSTRPTPQVAD